MGSSVSVEGLAKKQVTGRRQSMRAGLAGMVGACSFLITSTFKVISCEKSWGKRDWMLETI